MPPASQGREFSRMLKASDAAAVPTRNAKELRFSSQFLDTCHPQAKLEVYPFPPVNFSGFLSKHLDEIGEREIARDPIPSTIWLENN